MDGTDEMGGMDRWYEWMGPMGRIGRVRWIGWIDGTDGYDVWTDGHDRGRTDSPWPWPPLETVPAAPPLRGPGAAPAAPSTSQSSPLSLPPGSPPTPPRRSAAPAVFAAPESAAAARTSLGRTPRACATDGHSWACPVRRPGLGPCFSLSALCGTAEQPGAGGHPSRTRPWRRHPARRGTRLPPPGKGWRAQMGRMGRIGWVVRMIMIV